MRMSELQTSRLTVVVAHSCGHNRTHVLNSDEIHFEQTFSAAISMTITF